MRLSVQRERARIARDLHDIVSHHLAVMVIQAGAGRLAEPWQAEVAAERFATIRHAGDRRWPRPTGSSRCCRPKGRRAAPGAAAGAGGERGPRRRHAADLALEPEVEAVAYRVVQEALTNAMKHAPGAPLDIRVALADGGLTITARNDAVASASPIAATGSGLGLAGMRERLAALDGSLAAGPDRRRLPGLRDAAAGQHCAVHCRADLRIERGGVGRAHSPPAG